MPRVLALCAAAAAAGAAGTAFVGLPLPAGLPSLRRGAVALEAVAETEGLGYEAAPPSGVGAEQEQPQSLLKWLGAGLLAGIVVAASSAPAMAADPVPFNSPKGLPGGPVPYNLEKLKSGSGLVPCKDSKKFHKRIKDEIFKLTKRQNKYPAGSIVYNRMADQVALVKRREEAYGGRMCGKVDGLPRVLPLAGPTERGNLITPALMFLYIAGWIGWAGRSYLLRTQDEMKELLLDVPLAVTCMASGFSWPVAAWQEIVNGDMTLPQSEVYSSGRAYP